MRTTLLVSCALLWAGCAPKSSLRARSAGDMHCPADSLLIHRLDDRAYRVNGCGQEIVYISTCRRLGDATTPDQDCTWTTDSALRESPPSDATSAAPGCGSDAQCKGDRICVHKECVAP